MCEIKLEDIKKIESIIFRFLWNSKWNGNRAPDRIKRDYLKNTYENGGLKAPDIKILNDALKVKQFIRAMASKHQINLVQKYTLESDGYFEFHKTEYAKISTLDEVTAVYQKTTNFLTDQIRSGELPDFADSEQAIQNRVNIIASTDVIEYFRRRNIPLVIHRFRELADQGVGNLHELINESRFPRNDRLQRCAREILSFIPVEWIDLVIGSLEIDPTITYNETYFSNKWQLISHTYISVKKLRELLICKFPTNVKPYLNHAKFEITNIDDEQRNPFLLARTALHAPRDRFYKFRVLHGDIYCNSRMYRFKMVESPDCKLCANTIETIKHVLWDCPRSARAWEFLNRQTRDLLGLEYINYNSVILGHKHPNMAMETMITWTIKLIMSINREELISNEVIMQKFKTLFYFEKKTYGLNSKKFMARWGALKNLF